VLSGLYDVRLTPRSAAHAMLLNWDGIMKSGIAHCSWMTFIVANELGPKSKKIKAESGFYLHYENKKFPDVPSVAR
jgi:hypothetical protein